MGLLLAAALLPVLAGPFPGRLHPDSFGEVALRLDGGEVLVEVRSQGRTLLEVPWLDLDADGDGELAPWEVEEAWPRIQAYYEGGLALLVDGELQALAFSGHELRTTAGLAGAAAVEGLVLRARRPLEAAPASLGIRYDLFFEDGNPGHRVQVRASGLSLEPRLYILGAGLREVEFPVLRGLARGRELLGLLGAWAVRHPAALLAPPAAAAAGLAPLPWTLALVPGLAAALAAGNRLPGLPPLGLTLLPALLVLLAFHRRRRGTALATAFLAGVLLGQGLWTLLGPPLEPRSQDTALAGALLAGGLLLAAALARALRPWLRPDGGEPALAPAVLGAVLGEALLREAPRAREGLALLGLPALPAGAAGALALSLPALLLALLLAPGRRRRELLLAALLLALYRLGALLGS